MAKPDPHFDVLVLGEHPATYFAAALLRLNLKIRVLHATIPDERVIDRLALLNPAFFGLHKTLEPLRRKLDLHSVYGVQFLADDPATRSEYRAKAAVAHVALYKDVRAAMIKLAHESGAELVTPKTLQIHGLDEGGIDVTLGRATVRPKALILGGILPEAQQKLLGLPDSWGPDLVHRYTFVRLKGAKWSDLSNRPTVPMSLDLGGRLTWAWMLPHDGQVQLAVEQPANTVRSHPPQTLLNQWAEALRRHGILKPGGDLHLDAAESVDVPFAGALAHEGVANRTLLVGPAGGFYAATGEDLYPNCWSAVYAVEVLKKALKEVHLQDALQPYRQRWRTTLGDYLRGPQQNLRFLLPLVYRNQVMTSRLAESILLGKSLVR